MNRSQTLSTWNLPSSSDPLQREADWQAKLKGVISTVEGGERPTEHKPRPESRVEKEDPRAEMGMNMPQRLTAAIAEERISATQRLERKIGRYRPADARAELEQQAKLVAHERSTQFRRNYGDRDIIRDNISQARVRTPDLVRAHIAQQAADHEARLAYVVAENKRRNVEREEVLRSRQESRRGPTMTTLQKLAMRSPALIAQGRRWEVAISMLSRHRVILERAITAAEQRKRDVAEHAAASLIQNKWRAAMCDMLEKRRKGASDKIRAAMVVALLRRRVKAKKEAAATIVEFIEQLRNTARICTAIRQYRWCVTTTQSYFRRHRLQMACKRLVMVNSFRVREAASIHRQIMADHSKAAKDLKKRKAAASSAIVKAAMSKNRPKKRVIAPEEIDAARVSEAAADAIVDLFLRTRQLKSLESSAGASISPLLTEEEVTSALSI